MVIKDTEILGYTREELLGKDPSDLFHPEEAERLYEYFVSLVREQGVRVECGRFRTHMDVTLVNDGPVTLLLDSAKSF